MMQMRRVPAQTLVPLLEEQLRVGCANLPVTGSSMSPMLRHGRDVVKLEKADGPLKPGDVLFYRRDNGQYILHRLIRMEDEQTCLMCGDNQWQRELLPAKNVIARVVCFTRDGKWVDCKESKGYRLYTKIWTGLFPVRRPMIAVRRILGRLRRILGRNGK